MTDSLPPNYSAIIQEIAQQVRARSSLLIKRTLLLIWPFVLLSIIVGVFYEDDLGKALIGPSALIFFPLLILAIIYEVILSYVFKIERLIWIDSYFDGQKLTSQHSLAISFKLLWPMIQYNVLIFLKYYSLLFLWFFGILLAGIFFYRPLINLVSSLGFLVAASLVIIYMALLIWPLVLIILLPLRRLRFAPFTFIDHAMNPSTSFRAMLDEAEKLGKIAEEESFKKTVAATLGTASVNALASGLAQSLGSTVPSSLPGFGKVIGGFGKEFSRQATSLGKIVAIYLLYRFARKQLLGQEQLVNSKLYNLAA